jgi:hypothetical protein
MDDTPDFNDRHSWVKKNNIFSVLVKSEEHPSSGERLPLEAVTRRLVKTWQAEKTYECAVVNCRV